MPYVDRKIIFFKAFVRASTTYVQIIISITLINVYAGTAKIIPVTPASIPAILITIKISKGCAFTLFE